MAVFPIQPFNHRDQPIALRNGADQEEQELDLANQYKVAKPTKRQKPFTITSRTTVRELDATRAQVGPEPPLRQASLAHVLPNSGLACVRE
ncbi:hypothetical protein COLO4_04750 [Corchorus olitorius]|uniref:Uncharacterized protein n=1 Tax=Corchorus olitorius TaxID=93759 RepID=A0A1R3KSX3_9ROSI|nr:hypothetical protein COLO4_04750 [Corchorus olitorius]